MAEKLDKIVVWLTTTSSSPFAIRGRALQKFSDFLRTVFSGGNTLQNRERVKECYKVFIQPESQQKQSKNDGWNKKKTVNNSNGKVICYWCFSPGFGMRQLVDLGIHSVILTSGTLSPLKPFISELGIPIDIQLENPHIVKPEQICVGVLSNGPDGHPLNSSYNTRNDPKYVATLGRTIYNFSCLIPDGLLVFFPSYPIMKKCRDDWQATGLWTSITQKKPIYVETQSKENFGNTMNEFYEKIRDPNAKGAIFLAVCRGKVSEGLDFADANGRAVLITGLPYPPMMDPRVMLKQKYLDEMRIKNKDALSGQQWYQLEASRAVNQAVGRIIRHINDYGAIILCDCRFGNASFKGQLSAWLRPYIKNFSNFGIVTRQLRDFFKNAQKFPQPKLRTNINYSLPAIGAAFESNRQVLTTSSIVQSKTIEEDKFDLSCYNKEKNVTVTAINNTASGSSEKIIDFSTSKAQGSWSQTTWRTAKELAGETCAKKRKLNIKPMEINYTMETEVTEIQENIPMSIDNSKVSKSPQNKKQIGETYLKAVKKTLIKEQFQVFAKLVETYKKNGDVQELLRTLEILFPADGASRYLFWGFEAFLKKQHLQDFKVYLSAANKK